MHDLEEPQPEKRSPLLLVLAAGSVLVLGAVAFGLAFYIGDMGDSAVSPQEPPPTEVIPPEASSAERTAETGEATDEASMPAEVEATNTAEAPPEEPPAPVMLQITSEPGGAEVYGPDRALLGNTPFEIAQPAAGAPPMTITLHLAGYQDRDIPLSHLSSPQLNIRMVRARASGRHRPRQTRPVITPPTPPQVRTLPPVAPVPRRPQPSGNSEIVNPW
ncbi:MAG TPA: hypothetical protein ENK57_14120 [Polyangiaceae bacterium]|nr:hypothetical protein [Polyangiaceae bacterium]